MLGDSIPIKDVMLAGGEWRLCKYPDRVQAWTIWRWNYSKKDWTPEMFVETEAEARAFVERQLS